MPATKQQILDSLHRFASQRPGLDFRNYGNAAAYRQESREITRDLNQARILLLAVEWRDSITAAHIIDAARSAYSGRLTIDPETAEIKYTTGQYRPTEYRRAVCAVCAATLWACMRDFYIPPRIEPLSVGECMRRRLRIQFGPAIANRWFN